MHLPSTLRRLAIAVPLALVPPALDACATTSIPNTTVPDTSANREIVNVAERYRRAVEQRDVQTLLSMAAPNYFEDGGTPQGDDDYGLDGLRRLLGIWSDEVREIRYETRYRAVTFERQNNRALIDFTYTGSFTLRRPPIETPEGIPAAAHASVLNTDPARPQASSAEDQEVWYRRVADNRLELERVDGQWRIVAGM